MMTDGKRFTLRLPDTLHDLIEKRANKHLRSLNSEIVVLLKMGLVNETAEPTILTKADKLISRMQIESHGEGSPQETSK